MEETWNLCVFCLYQAAERRERADQGTIEEGLASDASNWNTGDRQFVVFTFWTLYLYDRELVYPKLLDNFIPQWLNHGMVRPTFSTPIKSRVCSFLICCQQ
ncbi:hypothetical protein ATANTOWER_028223 [Ataeniobius toweri]|uniref:Uncharacterized protein n=1 Tax=Ataeniobius toweri TaxID=208326 RepID=A0ABU7AI80_9TELE|nr:hypothetical protein [Ataeniobius toweri]